MSFSYFEKRKANRVPKREITKDTKTENVATFKILLHSNNNWLKDAGYTMHDEEIIYDAQLVDILTNTRWYLDNLDKLPTYRVSWKNYHSTCPVVPYRFTFTQQERASERTPKTKSFKKEVHPIN